LVVTKNPILVFFSYLAAKDLKKKAKECTSLKDLVELSLTYEYSPFIQAPSVIYLASLQKKKELYTFSKEISKLNPKIILEIGTANGGTLFLLSRIAGKNSTVISIDLPIEPFYGGIDYKSKLFFKSFALESQEIVLLRRDSHHHATLKILEEILNGRKLDVLFIDGDHTYKGVKKDFEMYSPLVRQNGIIAFHDIVDVPLEENVEVKEFWNEIKGRYIYKEFVDDWDQGNCGIGLIYKE
jgi:predicted O-methyltransferase YrrM